MTGWSPGGQRRPSGPGRRQNITRSWADHGLTTNLDPVLQRQSERAYEQAIMVRAHVEQMREDLECSLLYLAEAKRALDGRDMPAGI